MKFSETQIARAAAEWSKIAKEDVTVEQTGGTLYAFGSELACLRLFHAFRGTSTARVEYSTNLSTWFFAK